MRSGSAYFNDGAVDIAKDITIDITSYDNVGFRYWKIRENPVKGSFSTAPFIWPVLAC